MAFTRFDGENSSEEKALYCHLWSSEPNNDNKPVCYLGAVLCEAAQQDSETSFTASLFCERCDLLLPFQTDKASKAVNIPDCPAACKKAEESWSRNSEEVCVICLEPLRNNSPVGFLNACLHNFHFDCIENWHRGGSSHDPRNDLHHGFVDCWPNALNGTCPLCREKFEFINYAKYPIKSVEDLQCFNEYQDCLLSVLLEKSCLQCKDAIPSKRTSNCNAE